MLSKYLIRDFKIGGHYHVFNCGANMQKIFLDQQDFQMFEYYLFVYLAPGSTVSRKYPNLPSKTRAQNISGDIDLIAYCLMPDHFHLLVRLHWMSAVSDLVQRVTSAYTHYFNVKYGRSGTLMEEDFQSVELQNQAQLLHLSRYIHNNPVREGLASQADTYKWSSMADYQKGRFRPFIYRRLLQECRMSAVDYHQFVAEASLDVAALGDVYIKG